jgi:hypothetical protein
MQTVIHIYCTAGKSLREAIQRDQRLETHLLQIGKARSQAGRRGG